ncbi:MAG: hypothetical protein PGN09_10395 [Sphingomonas fennica]
MAPPPAPPSRAAGVFLAIGAIGGAILGARAGQPSAGLLIGLGAGIAIALALWLYDRSRARR